MILLDANLLVYAHVGDFAQHQRAHAWLDAQLDGSARVGLPWPSLLGFLRLVTNPRIFERPENPADAWSQVTDWLSRDNVWIPEPTERHPGILGQIIAAGGVSANLVPDAHLAALAMEHGLTLASTDGDFGRFKDLRWLDPLRS